MRCVVTAVIALTVCGSTLLHAGDWISADGAVTVEIPDPGRFAEGPLEPPLQKVWQRTDGAVRMAIIRFPLPDGMPAPAPGPELLNDLAQGLLSELARLPGQARLISSSIEQHEGATIYKMTATVTDGGHALFSTQWVLYADTVAYKLMAVGAGVDTQSDPDVQRFLLSLRPSLPPVQRRTAPLKAAILFAAMFWGGVLVIVVIAVLVAKFAAGVPFARSSAVVVLLLSALCLISAIGIAPAAENASVLVGQFLPTVLTAILGLWLWNRSHRNVRGTRKPDEDFESWLQDQEKRQS